MERTLHRIYENTDIYRELMSFKAYFNKTKETM